MALISWLFNSGYVFQMPAGMHGDAINLYGAVLAAALVMVGSAIHHSYSQRRVSFIRRMTARATGLVGIEG